MAVAESAPQADTRSVCVIRVTVEQHFNWYRVSRGSTSDRRQSEWPVEKTIPGLHKGRRRTL